MKKIMWQTKLWSVILTSKKTLWQELLKRSCCTLPQFSLSARCKFYFWWQQCVTMWSCKLCIHQVAVYKQTLNLWHYGLREAKFVTNYLQLNPDTSSSCWLVWPIRPSDKSDAIVAGFLYMFLSGYISISRRRVPTSFPQWPSRPLWGLLF